MTSLHDFSKHVVCAAEGGSKDRGAETIALE